jgi:hypothetical protein
LEQFIQAHQLHSFIREEQDHRNQQQADQE